MLTTLMIAILLVYLLQMGLDLTITDAQVLPDTTGTIVQGVAGGAIPPGRSCYYDETAGQWKLADADAVATASGETGISVSEAAATGQMVSIQKGGTPTIGAGAAPVVGMLYVVATTAGGIAPYADLGSGDFVALIGIGVTGNKIRVRPWATEVAKA